MTARRRTDIVIIFVALFVAGTFGYFEGKHNADRWYAHHQPIAATPQIITGIEEHDIRPLPHAPVILYALDAQTCEWGYVDDQREGHLYEGPCEPNKVKLIPPIKVRTAAPVASVEEPR
jgi:hypothetical protein